jgi:hypothetical protein
VRQLLHLLSGDAEPDSGIDPLHGADRDGDFLVPLQVSFPEQHMGHLVIGWTGEEASHLPDLTMNGVDASRPHLCLAERNDVLDDRPVVDRSSAT